MEHQSSLNTHKVFRNTDSLGSGIRQQTQKEEVAAQLRKKAERVIAEEIKAKGANSSTPLDLNLIRRNINSYRKVKGIK